MRALKAAPGGGASNGGVPRAPPAMIFQDRLDAADQLATALAHYRDRQALVLAIPRGAVAMGQRIAQRLGADFDLVLVRKLRAPFSPEFAVGAVDETGWCWLSPHAHEVGADPGYLAGERARQLDELHRRRLAYCGGRPPADAAGRLAIVVDDGLATGATMIAALHAVRAQAPARLVCAVPVGARESLETVSAFADEVVCLHRPALFGAVGAFYRDFRQVDDAEVAALLGLREPS